MQKFIKISSIAASLIIDNIDTDMIIPKQFLKTITRTGLGNKLFYEMRYKNNEPQPNFILNKEPFNKAKILLSASNFGCGSSREHAPWALLDFGISCVIAESFADIFYNNCFENGILPIVLTKNHISELCAANREITVDLENKSIEYDNTVLNFEVDEFKRNCLLKGIDIIGITMEKLSEISSFEAEQKINYPWL